MNGLPIEHSMVCFVLRLKITNNDYAFSFADTFSVSSVAFVAQKCCVVDISDQDAHQIAVENLTKADGKQCLFVHVYCSQCFPLALQYALLFVLLSVSVCSSGCGSDNTLIRRWL